MMPLRIAIKLASSSPLDYLIINFLMFAGHKPSLRGYRFLRPPPSMLCNAHETMPIVANSSRDEIAYLKPYRALRTQYAEQSRFAVAAQSAHIATNHKRIILGRHLLASLKP